MNTNMKLKIGPRCIGSNITFFSLLLSMLCFQNIKAINNIRWGSNDSPLHGLTITWSNSGSNDSIKWGYTSSLEKGSSLGLKRNGYSGSFFKCTFPDVTANSTLYYQLYDSKTSSWSALKIFKTAPPADTKNFSFLAMGDSRDGLNTWNKVSNLGAAKKTNFTIFNGDIVANGGNGGQWDSWFNQGANFLGNNIVYHSLGNHDAASVPTFLNNFELPKGETSSLYYSFTYGKAIFICLNSENPGDAAQANWLVQTLKTNQDKKWKVVFFHKPFFTIGTHAGEMNGYLNSWWKAFDDFGVDLICNGHDHMYERTKPINMSISAKAPVTTYGNLPGQGRCQIVCGGSGAPLYSGSPNWFIESYKSNYNFCKFDIKGSILYDTTYSESGAILESFVIDKSAQDVVPPDTTIVPPVDTTGNNHHTTNISVNTKNQVFNPLIIVPNPVEGNFSLHYTSAVLGEALIKIFDVAGKEIASESVQKTKPDFEYKYNLSGQQPGVYVVKVIMDKQIDSALLILK